MGSRPGIKFCDQTYAYESNNQQKEKEELDDLSTELELADEDEKIQ